MVDRAVITAFAKATIETYHDMVQTQVAPRRAKTDAEKDPGQGVHAIIGMEGVITGTISMSMPDEVAKATVGHMVGCEYQEITADIVDGVQELVNIIIGRAKKHLELSRLSFMFGLPKCLVGIQFPTPEDDEYRNLGIVFSGSTGSFLEHLTWKWNRDEH